MKKTFFFLLLLSLTFLNIGYSQCKYKGVPGKLKRYFVSDSKPKPDVATSQYLLFDRVYFSGSIGFAKTGDQYYVCLYMARHLSKRFDVHSTNLLRLTTSSGQEIEVFPTGDYSGKRLMNWYGIGCYYKLSKKQLEILATENLESLQLYFYSEHEMDRTHEKEGDGGGWQKDADGNNYFKHFIEADAKKEKCRMAATCMLQK